MPRAADPEKPQMHNMSQTWVMGPHQLFLPSPVVGTRRWPPNSQGSKGPMDTGLLACPRYQPQPCLLTSARSFLQVP